MICNTRNRVTAMVAMLAVATACFFLPSAHAGIDDGLIAYYPFDGDANDWSGFGNNATAYNDYSYVSGVLSDAIHLVGSGHTGLNGGHVLLPFIPLNELPEFSISMWVNYEGSSSSYDHGVHFIQFGDMLDPQGTGSTVSIVASGYFPNNTVHFGVGGNPTKGRVDSPYGPDFANSWNHLALRGDNGTLTGFVNGAAVGSSSYELGSMREVAGLGTSWFNSGGTTANRFIGSIDDVRIWDRALSASEVASLSAVQEVVLSSVPEYEWRRGCSPTSATMIMGYWDQNGYPKLWTETPPASNNPTDNNDSVNVVIEHMGDLMGTDTAANGGGTSPSRIPKAMRDFAQEKDENYKFKAGNKYASDRFWHAGSWFEGFSFDFLKREIDADRPMHIGVKIETQPGKMGGHSIVAYGYQDNPGTDDDWVSVNDTWVDGPSTGGYPVTNKVEDGTEWWKWVTDTTEDYYIYRGGWLHADLGEDDENAVWGIQESTFSSETAFEEQFEVTTGASGDASLVTLASAPQEMAVRLLAEGEEGNDDCVLASWIPMADLLNISFDYAFETAGTLELLLNDQLMAEVTDLSGLGIVDEPSDFQSFSEEFIVSDWGLDPNETYEFELRLLAGSTHIAFLDNLQVVDLGATRIPEPNTLALLALATITFRTRRFRKR